MEAVHARPERSPRALLAIAVALLLLVVIACAALALFGAKGRVRYRRYVSQPLPDGTRYTFLYPEELRTVVENGGNPSPGVVRNVTVYNSFIRETDWDRLRRKVGLGGQSHDESISVLPYAVKGGIARDRRWSDRWTRGGRTRHNEFIDDRRTQLQFALYLDAPADESARFQTIRPTVVRSFELLPPGTEPPSP
jgi:hypothetical protein